MIAFRPLLGALGAGVLLSLGILAPPSSASIAAAAPILAQTDGQPASNSGGPSFPNPLAGLGQTLSISRLKLRPPLGEWSLTPRDRIVLGILGRHPFLADEALADVLGRTVGWARARRAELVRRGLARVVDRTNCGPPMQGRRELVEVTIEGLRMLAGYVGLSLPTALRYHGLTGGGPRTPVGPRRALLANLDHTLAADGVCAAIARVARTRRDGSLVDWRNASACIHGRMRPDGYGLLRLGRREYGFFLEFDRSTVPPAARRAKVTSYLRYTVSARAAREYDGFPTILVVTLRPGTEDRIADAVLAAHAGHGQASASVAKDHGVSGSRPRWAFWANLADSVV